MADQVSQEKDGSLVVEEKIEDTRVVDLFQKLDPDTEVFEEKKAETDGGEKKEVEVKAEDKKEEDETGEKKEEVKVEVDAEKEALKEEILTLRQANREFKKGMNALNSKYERVEKLLDKANLIDPEMKEKESAEKAAFAARQDYLEEILEIMIVNPKYEDVEEVVSQKHFDDLVDALTVAYIKENGGDEKAVSNQIASDIWGRKNPYKYIYEMVKKYHPDYRKVEEEKKEPEKKEKEIPKVPGSIHDIPGGKTGDQVGGWTSQMIDDLDETELGKVPKDVYDKYLKNLLP